MIGGDGLARGYRGRPNLSAERFVESRSAATGSGRLYRTGDLARLLPDGTLECLGRIDHQVKIRGFRIEPGEIERVLEEHPSVRTAVVVARTDGSGLKRLVAYFMGASAEQGAGLATELRERVREALPPQMTPSVFVPLDELPLTGSGKIDRNALPDPSSALEFTPTGSAPSTPTELAIAAAFEEVLEIAAIGVDDDFFELGGHSLLLHQVRTRLSESLGLELAMVELTRHPKVAALADHLDRRGDRACDDTGVYGRGNPQPLATMARRFLIPRTLLTLYFMWKFRAKVSPRAEVELSRNLDLGRGTTIGSFTKLKADKGPLVIGERSSFANGCFVGSGPGGLRIGANLICGPNVTIVPSNYVIDRKDVHLADQGHTSQGIRIGENVWIGAGSVVLDGAEIGDNTVVTAGSVVDRKFEGDCVLRGNPAEIVARR
jgi:acetyltransferase-like isoleucine patch superfamily enzyme